MVTIYLTLACFKWYSGSPLLTVSLQHSRVSFTALGREPNSTHGRCIIYLSSTTREWKERHGHILTMPHWRSQILNKVIYKPIILPYDLVIEDVCRKRVILLMHTCLVGVKYFWTWMFHFPCELLWINSEALGNQPKEHAQVLTIDSWKKCHISIWLDGEASWGLAEVLRYASEWISIHNRKKHLILKKGVSPSFCLLQIANCPGLGFVHW